MPPKKEPLVGERIRLPNGNILEVESVVNGVIRGRHFIHIGRSLRFWTSPAVWWLLRDGLRPERL